MQCQQTYEEINASGFKKKITLPFILIRWSRNGSRLSLGGVWPSVSKGHTFSGVDKACACGDLTGHHCIAA